MKDELIKIAEGLRIISEALNEMAKKVPFRKRSQTTMLPPTNLAASNTTETTTELSWTNNHTVADGIYVLQDGVQIASLGSDANAYSVTGLDDGTTYVFEIFVHDPESWVVSDPLSVTTVLGAVPTITINPSNKSVEDGDTVQFQAGAINYDTLQWQVYSGGSWADISGATALNYSFTAALADDGKQYRLCASNTYGESYSSSATLAVSAASGLVAVTDLSASAASSTQVDLTWTDPNASETGYRIYRDGSLVHTTAANATSWSDTTVSAGVTYIYRVDAFDGSNQLAGNNAPVSTAGPKIATHPQDEWIFSGGTGVFGVSMWPDQGAVTYQWEKSTDSGSSWSDVSGATSQYYEATFTNADNGAWYRCKCTTGAGTVTSSHATLTCYAHEYHQDTNTAIAAWGFKKTRAAYSGNCCRISDQFGVETDIGWSGGDVDIAAIEAAAGSAQAYLVRLFDQGPVGADLVFNGANPPKITDANGVVLKKNGIPYIVGVDPNGGFLEADFTSSPFSGDDIHLMMLMSMDYEKAVANNVSLYHPFPVFDLNGDNGLYITNDLRGMRQRFGGVYSNKVVQELLDTTWVSFTSKPRRQSLYRGFSNCDRIEGTSSQAASMGTGHVLLRFEISDATLLSEVVLYDHPADSSELKERITRADRNYCVAPKDDTFAGMDIVSRDQYKLLQWIDSHSESDFDLPKISNKTANSVSITGPDLSWLPVGELIRYGTGAQGNRDSLTTASTGTYLNGVTTFTVNELTDGVSIGDNAVVDPFWDGSTTDYNEAARVWLEWSYGTKKFDQVLGRGENTMIPSKWFKVNIDNTNRVEVPLLRAAGLDSAQPTTTGLETWIKQDASLNRKVVLLEYDVSGLAPGDVLMSKWILNAISDETEDGDLISLGIVGAVDTSFDAATVTWNTSPIQLSPFPTSDDALHTGKTGPVSYILADLRVTEFMRSAVAGGASTVTFLIYPTSTQSHEFKLTDYDLIVAKDAGINAFRINDVLNLNFVEDPSHHTGWAVKATSIYSSPLPLADGKNGNIFYHWVPLGRRCLMMTLAPLVQHKIRFDIAADMKQLGGALYATGYPFKKLCGLLDEATRRSAENLLTSAMVIYGIKGAVFPDASNWDNNNQTWKGVEGGGSVISALRDPTQKALAIRGLRMAVTGREDGDFSTSPIIWKEDSAVLRPDGCMREGNTWFALSHETDYFGRAAAHAGECLKAVVGESGMDWFRDAMELTSEHAQAISFEEYNGNYHGESTSCGRTYGQPFPHAQHNPYANIGFAHGGGHAWFARNLVSGVPLLKETLEEQISAAITAVNAVTFDAGDLEWLESGVYYDYPLRSFVWSQCWPSEASKAPEETDWAVDLRDLLYNVDQSLSTIRGSYNNWSNGTWTFPKDAGTEDFILVQQGSGDKRCKILLQGNPLAGGYGGSADGNINYFWKWGYGAIICGLKPSVQSVYTGDKNLLPAPLRNNAEAVVCQFEDPPTYEFSSKTGYKLVSGGWSSAIDSTVVQGSKSAVWDGTDELNTSMQILDRDYGFLESGDTLSIDKDYRILNFGVDGADGIEVSCQINYSSSSPKTVLELYHTIPLFTGTASNVLSSLSFSYWTGLAWFPVTTFDEWVSGIRYVRLEKDHADGNGKHYAWIDFGSSSTVKFNSSERTQTSGRIKPIELSLHPGTEGVATTLPPTTSWSWKLLIDDPGLVQTVQAPFIITPSASTAPVEGEMWLLNGLVEWGPKTPDYVAYEYSTDYAGDEGAATWNTIGTATLVGSQYQYYGGTVPSGVTAVRIDAVANDASSQTYVKAISSVAYTLNLSDTCTDTDGVNLVDHTPDYNISGASYVNGVSSKWLSISSNELIVLPFSDSDNGGYARLPVGSGNYVMQVSGQVDTAGTAVRGFWIGPASSTKSKCFVIVDGIQAVLREKVGSSAEVRTIFGSGLSANTKYYLRLIKLGNNIGFRVYASDGTTVLIEGAKFETVSDLIGNSDYPTWGISRNGKMDELQIWLP